MGPGALCPLPFYSPDPLSACLQLRKPTPYKPETVTRKKGEAFFFFCHPWLGCVQSFIQSSVIY